MNELQFPSTFSIEIRQLIQEKEMECIDAVIFWCEQNNYEVEYAASLIKNDPVMLFDIQVEAENLHYLKKTSRLPV
jgi:hypothetical protein